MEIPRIKYGILVISNKSCVEKRSMDFAAVKRQGCGNIKECRSIVRDESSVYFNVTAKHV